MDLSISPCYLYTRVYVCAWVHVSVYVRERGREGKGERSCHHDIYKHIFGMVELIFKDIFDAFFSM